MASREKHRQRSKKSFHDKESNLLWFNRKRYMQENPNDLAAFFNALRNSQPIVMMDDAPKTQEHREQNRGN